MTRMTRSEQGAAGRFINLGSPASQDNIGAQTVVAYCKMSAAQTVVGHLFSKGTLTDANGPRFTVAINGSFSFGADSSTATNPVASTAAGAVNITSVWQHLQATWDGTINTTGIALYKDDSADLRSTGTSGTGSITADAANDIFLLNRVGLGKQFEGAVGYVARWSGVLTSTQLANIRANGPGSEPVGLLMLWANEADFGPFALTATRSTFVDGGVPANTALTTYPIYLQYLGSKERHVRGRRAVRATNGAIKVRTFFTTQKRAFEVAHLHLTSAEKTAWDAFYAANTNTLFSFIWGGDGQTYSVVFDDQDPSWQPMEGIRWGITQGLLQV